jgi:23S rRNA pseudouridine1911/1915/1917 synthase
LKIQRQIQIKVPPGQKKLRIDKYLALHIENSSRTKIQKTIEAGCVSVNSRIVKSNYILLPNDNVEIFLPDVEEDKEIVPENIPLEILYEDDYLIIVNKPAGMVTHPAYKNNCGTLVNALLFHIQKNNSDLSKLYGFERAGIVHRLDKNTSGILVVAKDEETHRQLSKLFSKHDIEREYWALCWGIFRNKKGIIEKSLGRSTKDRKKVVVKDDGKIAITHYEVIKEYEFLSLVKLNLKTGRTHQIRVHMHSLGHPVFGDPDYDGRKVHGIQLTNRLREEIKILLEIMQRQALHAKLLGFVHPGLGKKMLYESELPEDMKKLIDALDTF